MNQCSPVEMRKNLEVVEQFKKVGIDFVAVPVLNEGHKERLIDLQQSHLEVLINRAEA